MNRWYWLSQSAAKRALQFRSRRGLAFETPCDIYDVIDSGSVELQFTDIPTLEGMYLEEKGVKRICVCSQRPWGRQRFTAAHELGHSVMDHGSQIDEVIETTEEGEIADEEILADGFARFLLMPPRAVAQAFAKTARYDADSIYRASCWLGVGYTTLVRQMCSSLKMIDSDGESALLKIKRHEICGDIVGDNTFRGDAWPLDERWDGRALHVQVGDIVLGINPAGITILAPLGSDRASVKLVGAESVPLKSGGEITLRVSRRNYSGFYDYRYLPE